MRNAVYFQSGGPTSVINASFYGVIEACKQNKSIDNLYGSLYGIDGLINDKLVLIDKDLNEYEELKFTSGAILGTCRKCLKEEDEVFYSIINTLNKHEIKYVFVNGGNDSMDTADKLNKYFIKNNIDIVVIGIPKTIDNDLALTDHCPGFGSNAKFVVRNIMEIFLDINSYEKGRVTIVEIMGRDTGWLTASSVCAKLYNMGPDLIYVPEAVFDKDKFLCDVENTFKEKGHCLVCVAEALKDKDGEYISTETSLDAFGHKQLGSVSKYLEQLVKNNLKINTRSIEFSLPQRCACHLQSKIDREEAISCGAKAVEYALEGKRGMVGIVRDSFIPYKSHLELFDLSKIANVVKLLPKEYINKEGNYINDSYIEYVKPFLDLEEIKIEISHMFI